MASDGDAKTKYTRDYVAHQPYIGLGPMTWILDTIVLPVAKEDDGSSRTISRQTQS